MQYKVCISMIMTFFCLQVINFPIGVQNPLARKGAFKTWILSRSVEEKVNLVIRKKLIYSYFHIWWLSLKSSYDNHHWPGEKQESAFCLRVQQRNTGGDYNQLIINPPLKSVKCVKLKFSWFPLQVTYLKNFSLFVEPKVETLGIQEHVSLGKTLVSNLFWWNAWNINIFKKDYNTGGKMVRLNICNTLLKRHISEFGLAHDPILWAGDEGNGEQSDGGSNQLGTQSKNIPSSNLSCTGEVPIL